MIPAMAPGRMCVPLDGPLFTCVLQKATFVGLSASPSDTYMWSSHNLVSIMNHLAGSATACTIGTLGVDMVHMV
jgi:hypothetical protein